MAVRNVEAFQIIHVTRNIIFHFRACISGGIYEQRPDFHFDPMLFIKHASILYIPETLITLFT